MSLTPEFAADARLQWRALDPEDQEVALDIIDRLALASPPNGENIGDEIHEKDGIRKYVVVRAWVDRTVSKLTILGVGSASYRIN